MHKGKYSKGEPSHKLTGKEEPKKEKRQATPSPARKPAPSCFVYTHDQLRHAPAATYPVGELRGPYPQPFQKPDEEMPPLGTAPLPIPPRKRGDSLLDDDLPHRRFATFTPSPTPEPLQVRTEEIMTRDEPWRRNPIVVDGSGKPAPKKVEQEQEDEDWTIIDALMSGCDKK